MIRRSVWVGVALAGAVLAAGCLRSRSKLDIPRNPKITHDLYDTLFPTRLEAGQFRERMRRKESVLQGLIHKVYTAPEWNAELDKIREERAASGLPPEEYKIHKGARFSIEVPQDAKLSRTYQVAPDGYIDVPHLGRIYVEGQTISQFKAMMVERLAEIIRRPEVHVNFEGALTPYGALRAPEVGSVYVFGPVVGTSGGGARGDTGLRASRVPYTGRETLFEVLTSLSGVDETGGWDQTVVYRRIEKKKVLAIVSDLKLYVQRGDFDQDVPLEAYDVVYVPLEYSYTDDKIKAFLNYFLGWANLGLSMDDAVQDIETRVGERR